MTPRQFSFLRPHHHCLPPTSHWGLHGSWALLIEHDGDRAARSSGPTAPSPGPKLRCQRVHRRISRSNRGWFDANGDDP
jgi:hypothetical protein